MERITRHSVHLALQWNREIRNSIVESIANSAITNKNIANSSNIKLIGAATSSTILCLWGFYLDILALRYPGAIARIELLTDLSPISISAIMRSDFSESMNPDRPHPDVPVLSGFINLL